MPLDGRGYGLEQVDGLAMFLLSREHPVLPASGWPVACLDPGLGCVGMSTFGPVPYRLTELNVYVRKGFLTADVSVVVHPSSEDRVHLSDHRSRFCRWVAFENAPQVVQQFLDPFLCWLDQQLAMVFADVLPQKVKTFRDMYNACLLRVSSPLIASGLARPKMF